MDSPWMAFHVAVVGALCGLLAIFFNRVVVALGIYFAEEAKRLGRSPKLFLRRFAYSIVIGCCCGAFAIVLPKSQPCPDSSVQHAFYGTSGCILEEWLQQVVQGSRYVPKANVPREFQDDNVALVMSYEPRDGVFGAQYNPDNCSEAIKWQKDCKVPGIEAAINKSIFNSTFKATDFCCHFQDLDSLKHGDFFNVSAGREPKKPMNMGEDWPRGPCTGLTWDDKDKKAVDHYSPGAALTLVPPTAVVRNLLVRGAPFVLPMSTVATFLLGYFMLAACCSTAWIPGGLLVPMMCIGAAAGRLYGMLWHSMLGAAPPFQTMPWVPELQPLLQALYPQPSPRFHMEPGILAFAGCAAFLSGSGSLVMFVLVLLLEVTLEPFLIPVILISILSARSVTSLMKAHGLYHELMNVQSLPFLSETPHWRQSHYVVEDLLRQDAKTQREMWSRNEAHSPRGGGDLEAPPGTQTQFEREFPQLISLSRKATEADIVDALEKRLPGEERTEVNGFPVVEPASNNHPGGQLCGLVTRDALLGLLVRSGGAVDATASTSLAREQRSERSFSREPLAMPLVGLEDVMDSAPFVVQGSTPVVHAHMLFARCGLRHVVVVDSGHRPIGVLTRKSLMPWRTPWLDEDNLHHDTFLEQRAAHSPTASRGNSPPNTPPISRQGSYRLPGSERSSSFRNLTERKRSADGLPGEGLLSPLAESLRLTTMTAEEPGEESHDGHGDALVLEGADETQPSEAAASASQ